jgi:hypothetical protein
MMTIIKFLGEKSGLFIFNAISFIGVIIICSHFNAIFARLQIDVPGTNIPHRILHAVHGAFLGIIFGTTSTITSYLSEQIYLLQPR